ncbi:MAG: Zn-ribbon domain-containing OB-fold protein [Sphingorhabdus sp.]
MNALKPIAEGLWTDEAQPCLIGGRRKSDGKIVFPMPSGDAANGYDAVPLSRTGTLWSWTIQGFEPKAPYAGAQPFRPFGVGYVELPGEVIVETRLTTTTGLKIGTKMELVIEDFDGERSCFAFAPKEAGA